MSWFYNHRPYVPVAQRRAQAAREIARRNKNGRAVAPVLIEGRTIASSFWGKGWCDHLESYSDFANRLPRGRTYVRNGSVIDLQIHPGKVAALVQGSELYRIAIEIKALSPAAWKSVKKQCAGQIGSLVELLQGKLSQHVMEIVAHRETGLFPRPAEIKLSCSCPDWASMCKHVAAVLYGVGARLDQQPELLFRLRQVDHQELIAAATAPPTRTGRTQRQTVAEADLAGVFGIELADSSAPAVETPPSKRRSTPPAPKKTRAATRKPAAVPAETPATVTRAASTSTQKRVKAKIAAVRKRAAAPPQTLAPVDAPPQPTGRATRVRRPAASQADAPATKPKKRLPKSAARRTRAAVPPPSARAKSD